jgi:hypothetical protein
MSYSTDVFTKWVSDFESWDALRVWLQTNDGGCLRVVEPSDSPYALIRTVKGQSDFTLEHVRWCRSVVVHKDTRLPVSVAPPKASEFTNDLDPAVWCSAEEFVDGTMLNIGLCQDKNMPLDPVLSTRSRIGATGRACTTGPTFAEMFDGALANHNVGSVTEILPHQPSAAAVFKSVVLQHPANRIVTPIGSATYKIAHQGWVGHSGRVYIVEDCLYFFNNHNQPAGQAFFEIPRYNLEQIRSATSVCEWVTQQAQVRGYAWQGLVLKDGHGGRWRVRSSIYDVVHRIRGNETSVMGRFARHRREQTLEQYYVYYPEDREEFYTLEGVLRENTRRLSQYYTEVFRARKVQYHTLPWPYKHHVSVLHNLFKDTLRAEGKKVDLAYVVQYVNGLTLEDLAHMAQVHSLVPSKSKSKSKNILVKTMDGLL